MACDNIVNHKHFFETNKVIKEDVVTVVNVKPVVIDEPVTKVVKEVDENPVGPLYTSHELYKFNKEEQLGILTELRVSNKDIKKLTSEKSRVDKILSLI